jgi:hypothetical protein
MGLGMEGDDFYYWTLETDAWRLENGLTFSIRVLRASFKGRNADFRTHQVPYQVMTYFAVPFTNLQQKRL